MNKYIIPISTGVTSGDAGKVIKAASASPFQIAKTFGLDYVRKLIYGKQIAKQREFQDPNNPYPQFLDTDDFSSDTLKSKFFGTPIFDELIFNEGVYVENKKSVAYPKLILECALFDVAMSKNIVKTAIQGRKGTIKEYISEGDYQVNIKGVLCSESKNTYPDEEVSVLIQILKSNQALEVSSELLNSFFGVYNLVVESYNIPMMAGFQNTQKFEINCISDEPIEYRINKQV